MTIRSIPFDSALDALRNGNPYPMLSDAVRFRSRVCQDAWKQKASDVRDVLEAACSRNASVRLADKIVQIFVEDPDTNNRDIATKLLQKCLIANNALNDQQYGEWLETIIPKTEIESAVASGRESQAR